MSTTVAAAPHPPTKNLLLAALPAEDLARLQPHLEPLALPLGCALYESGDRQAHVYFPTEGIVSLLYVMENGASAEIAVAGNEGLVGVSLFMGGAARRAARSCRAPATPTGWGRGS
jgi:CRP-like cAMP-binding protein